jgi:hypothetical protein
MSYRGAFIAIVKAKVVDRQPVQIVQTLAIDYCLVLRLCNSQVPSERSTLRQKQKKIDDVRTR